MNLGSIVTGVFLRFQTNGIMTYQRLNAANNALNRQLLYSQGLLSKSRKEMGKYADDMALIAARRAQLITNISTGVAAVGVAAIGYGLDQAGKFQLAMASVGATLHSSASQLQALQQLALHTSGVTAQSASTTAEEMAVAARGLNTRERVVALFPELARFADVQYFMAQARGSSLSPVEAVSQGIQFAHMFQAYKTPQLHELLENITRLQTVQPEDLSKALMQAKYFVPLGNVLGLSQTDIFALLASMGQTGFLRGRGGSSLGRTFLGAIDAGTLTGHAQAKQHSALRDLGIVDSRGRNTVLTSAGTLDWHALMQKLVDASNNMKPAQYARDLKAAFGVISTQFMDVFASKAVQDQVGVIRRAMEGLGNDPIGKMFDLLMNQFFPALQLFTTNLTNVFINLFLPVLPRITAGLKSAAAWLGKLSDWLGAHPDWAKHIAEMLMLLTTAFGAISGVLTLGLLRGIWQLPGALKAVSLASSDTASGVRTLAGDMRAMGVASSAAGGSLATVSTLLLAIASVGAFFVGIAKDINDATHNPIFAKLLQWSMSGANHGAPVPGIPTNVWQDPFSGAVRRGPQGPFGGPPVTINVHVHGNATAADARRIGSAAASAVRQAMSKSGTVMTSPAISRPQVGIASLGLSY